VELEPGSFFGIGISTYKHYDALPKVVPELNELGRELKGRGFAVKVISEATSVAVKRGFRAWKQGRSQSTQACPVIFVWSGHGELSPSEADLYLIFRESRKPPTKLDTFDPQVIAEELIDARASQILIIIDTCHSGGFLIPALSEIQQVFQRMSWPPGETEPWVGLLASCSTYEQAQDGLMITRLLKLLRNGPTGVYRYQFSAQNPTITGQVLIDALRDDWTDKKTLPRRVIGNGEPGPMFPNPLYRPDAQSQSVDHLYDVARGEQSRDESTYFTGRHRLLNQIIDWMATPGGGTFLVTGPGGSGKSAVLSRIAALSNPELRSELIAQGGLVQGDPDPGPGSVSVHVTARNKRSRGLWREAAIQTGLQADAATEDIVAALHGHRVLLDALSEAAPGEAGTIAREFVAPLSRVAKLVIGTRAHVPGLRWETFAEDAELVDIRNDPDTMADLIAYVRRRLDATNVGLPHSELGAIAESVADLAIKGDGAFLYARLAAQCLPRILSDKTRNWRERLPDGISEAIEEDLGPEIESESRQRGSSWSARDLLGGIGFALGRGVPASRVWPTMASALSDVGHVYQDEDLDWVLTNCGRYIVEDGEDAQAVYRLFHDEVSAHFRARGGDALSVDRERAGQVAIARALVSLARRQSLDATKPELANPYLVHWLPLHVALSRSDEALDNFRGLTRLNPRWLSRGLRTALFTRAKLDMEQGHWRDALPYIEAAVSEWREAFDPSSASDTAWLAQLLSEQANVESELGTMHVQALNSSRESVDLFSSLTYGREGGLAADDTFAAPLSRSLNDLANRLSDMGQHDAAIDVVTKAIAIDRRLEEQSEGSNLKHLAIALLNKALFQSRKGDHAAALATINEAVAIFGPLHARNPKLYRREWASALRAQANRLIEAGDRDADAVEPIVEAIAIQRELASSVPALYLPELAQSLNSLGLLLVRLTKAEEALAPLRESIDIWRDLGEAGPQYRDALAMSLGNLGLCLTNMQSHEDAISAISEAVKIRSELAMEFPLVYFSRLAKSVRNLADALDAAGQGDAWLDHMAEVDQVLEPKPELSVRLARIRGGWLEAHGRFRDALATHVNLLRLAVAQVDVPMQKDLTSDLRKWRKSRTDTFDQEWLAVANEPVPPWLTRT
jgi:tetratricopeptide (TPR) repeat protein